MDSRTRHDFERSVHPHLRSGLSLARWITKSEPDAEDVVQEAYMRALKYFGSFTGTDARRWFLAIVRNASFALLNQRGVAEKQLSLDELGEEELLDAPLPGAAASPEQAALAHAAAEDVNRALGELPVEYREVIILRELEELSYREIAEVVSVPIGTVMSRLSRARQRLYRILAAEKVEG